MEKNCSEFLSYLLSFHPCPLSSNVAVVYISIDGTVADAADSEKNIACLNSSLLFLSCITMGKLFNYSEPQLSLI